MNKIFLRFFSWILIFILVGFWVVINPQPAFAQINTINYIDILPALKVRRFWVQTIVAGIASLTPSRPTDNALPVPTIISESRLRRTGNLKPIFLVMPI